MKEKFGQFKEFAGKLSSKVKRLIILGALVLVLGAVIIAFVLNNKPYGVLFSGLGEEEAQEIVAKLQEDGVEFRYNGDSTIMVREDQLDLTKATLVQEGYPKSGFTYNTFIENAGMMTTDSDKNTYKLYELQDRIGATIRLFDGVKDAKVTIALGEKSKYALSNEETERSTATAVVIMEDGGSPDKKQAEAIQRLVAKGGVPGMEMEDVAVFDGNGVEVSENPGAVSDSSEVEEIARMVEDQVSGRVMKILGSIYGEDNVRVSARAKINMEQLIRETITYNTPEKIDEEDKQGIVGKEETYRESSQSTGGTAGVAGTESNADTPQYNTDGAGSQTRANSESVSREYLVNQIKEQGQVTPGAVDDLTVSVAINGNSFGSLEEDQVRSLVGNAAGIAEEDWNGKITIASAPFYQERDDVQEEEEEKPEEEGRRVPLLYVLIGVALLVVLLAATIILLLLRRRKKRRMKEEAEIAVADSLPPVAGDTNQELQEFQSDKGMELKKNIRDFAEQNAEISAQLLKSWLNGGGEDGTN